MSDETLDAYRPLFTDLATSLHQDVDTNGADHGVNDNTRSEERRVGKECRSR